MARFDPRRWRESPLRIAAALFSGAVLKLVSPPIGLHWLHWFTFIPVLLALHWQEGPEARGRNFRLGYLSGISAVFCLFFWLTDTISTFSNIPFVLAAGILVLFSAVFGIPYGLLMMLPPILGRRYGRSWVYLFPCVWVGMEFLQPALFPYYQGVGQYRFPYTWQLASVFGAMSLSWLVLHVNSVIVDAIRTWRDSQRLPLRTLGIAGAVWCANVGFGWWRHNDIQARLHDPATPVLHASILQEGVTMVTRLEERGDVVLKSWVDLTAKVVDQHPDLIVWPEGSIYGNPSTGKLNTFLGGLASKAQTHILLGGGTAEADPLNVQRRLYWNSCYLFGPDARTHGRYDKMVPLPFGEYLPWPISYLRDYIEGPGNFRAGTEPVAFELPGVRAEPIRFSTPICYEAILEGHMRRLSDVDLFVNITNDGWFGDTAAPHQHAMLAAVHAMEFGRPMLRIAYTGISMVVDPDGSIREETAPYTEVARVVDVPLVALDTPYRTWGRIFPWITALIGFASLWRAWPRSGGVTKSPPPA